MTAAARRGLRGGGPPGAPRSDDRNALGFPDAGNNPWGTVTRAAYELISEGFGPGANGPLLVAFDLAAARRSARSLVAERLRADPDAWRPRSWSTPPCYGWRSCPP